MDIGIFIALFAISGGFAIAGYAMWLEGRKQRLRHVERMAMIEKGIAPPAMVDHIMEAKPNTAAERRGQRASGIFMICLGIGLSFLFYKYEEGLRSIWIGAFIAMIGVASLVNALMDERDARRQLPPPPRP